MKLSNLTKLFAGVMGLCLIATSAQAEHAQQDGDALGMLLGIAASYILAEQIDEQFHSPEYGNHRDQVGRRGYGNKSYKSRKQNNRGYSHQRGAHNPRENRFSSYTSEPIRGGSSRRTRVIENPYPNRMVTGITLTSMDYELIHIEDVIAYPYRQRLGSLTYTLSQHHPQRHIRTRDYIEYISLNAQHREYFTVTFHYQ